MPSVCVLLSAIKAGNFSTKRQETVNERHRTISKIDPSPTDFYYQTFILHDFMGHIGKLMLPFMFKLKMKIIKE